MATIRLVHTADNHIGLRFSSRGYSEAVRQRLVEERFLALQRLTDEASRRNAHFLVVAGDLFDRLDVPRRDVERAAAILDTFAGIHVVVLPGNHDYYDPGRAKLWEWFRDGMDEHRLLLLSAPVPVTIPVEDREVTFFPGPCTSKTSRENAIGWIAAAQKQRASVNIGIAHGSVTGISPDNEDRYFQMSPAELRAAGVDCWLLGHTHVRFPQTPENTGQAVFIPSTHTPDGFDCDHEGFVWYLELDDAGTAAARSLRTGAYRFLKWERDLRSLEALDLLERDLGALDPDATFLKLTLRGRLPAEGRERVAALKSSVPAALAYAEVYDDELGLNIDPAYIDRLYSQGSLPHQLLTSLARRPEDELALQLACDLIREART